MPTSQPVPAGTTSVLFTSSGVSAFLDLVDDVDDQFDQQLDSDPPTYIYEWSRFLNQARRDLKKKGASFKDTSKRLFSNPNSWHDYVAAVLEMVPPVNPVLKIQKQDTVTRNVTIIRYEITNDIFLEQMEQHVKWAPLERMTTVKFRIMIVSRHHCRNSMIHPQQHLPLLSASYRLLSSPMTLPVKLISV